MGEIVRNWGQQNVLCSFPTSIFVLPVNPKSHQHVSMPCFPKLMPGSLATFPDLTTLGFVASRLGVVAPHGSCVQVTEPCTLIPVVLGASQLVLVGDHKQLGPGVTPLGQEGGLHISLFERLLDAGITSHLLNVQYRMHPDIAIWPSQQYYGGRLLNGGNTITPQGVLTVPDEPC